MTLSFGLGMLFVGIVAILIGAGITFIVFKKLYAEMHKSKKRFDD